MNNNTRININSRSSIYLELTYFHFPQDKLGACFAGYYENSGMVRGDDDDDDDGRQFA